MILFLKVLAWVIVLILIISSVIFLIIEIDRKINIYDSEVTLSFDEFYQMYCIDPSKWSFFHDGGNYLARYEIVHPEDFSCYEYIYFKKTKDYYRFKRFIFNEEKKQNIESGNKKKLEVLKSFQNDIDEYKKKYCGD